MFLMCDMTVLLCFNARKCLVQCVGTAFTSVHQGNLRRGAAVVLCNVPVVLCNRYM
jgi:hypothetical protein